MKTYSSRLLLTASLVVFVMGIANHVQAQTVVTANVPFAFSVGGQEFPSGAYTFSPTSNGGSRLVLVRNFAANKSRFITAQVSDEPQSIDTLLNFKRYGTHYVLSSLSISGDAISLHVSPTRAEREMAAREAGEVVSIMASR
jgi:hypothetical protein